MPRAILYDYFRSSASYRARIALNLKGIEYEQRSINLAAGTQKDEAYRELNPQGFLAICNYVNSIVPEPPFMPADAADRAHVLALALTVACDIHPLNNLRVLKYLKAEFDAAQDATDEWYRHWVAEGLTALEAMAEPRAGAWLFGDAPSVADICLIPQLYNARRFSVPLDAFPTLRRVDETAGGNPAFAAAHPDLQEQPQ